MTISANTIRALVDDYLPYLTFAPTERFFPSNVDAWITNSIAEAWAAGGSRLSGTAVMNAPDTDAFPANYPSGGVMAGSQFPAGRRLRPSDLAELTGPAVTKLKAGEDVFINFGGWQLQSGGRADPDFTQGSPDRVYPHFSTLANAMSASNVVSADLLQNPDRTSPVVPQGRTPVVYAEIDWAGRFPRLADRLATEPVPGEFGPQNNVRDLLDRLIVFTYYFFYPLTDAPPGQVAQPGPSVVQREGQWEAVSLFVRVDPDHTTTTPGPVTPDGIQIPIPNFADPGTGSLPLLFLSYSAAGRADAATRPATVRLGSDPEVRYPRRPAAGAASGPGVGQIQDPGPVAPWRPGVFVTSGTHKNMFGPAATATEVDLGPNSDLAGAASGVGAVAGAANAIPEPTGAAFAASFLLGLVALILLLWSQADHQHGTSFSPTDDVDDDFVPPNGPTTVPGLSSTVTSGGAPVAPTVRAFSLLPPLAGEEADPLYRLPPWWNFPGRWGVRVEPSMAVRWDNGTHFRDLHGRSGAYWNTLALYRWMNLPENASSAMSLLTP